MANMVKGQAGVCKRKVEKRGWEARTNEKARKNMLREKARRARKKSVNMDLEEKVLSKTS